MFCAVSNDREALEVLAGFMSPVINDPGRVAAILAEADAMGFEFDD
ncbi:MAG: Immunity protein 51 [Ilumatobacteraceae bacterium]|nr:Immunity protein 51 [Ilumatobacteraceae bacterium]